jgi:hypothetical protein
LSGSTTAKYLDIEQIETAACVINAAVFVTDAALFVTEAAVLRVQGTGCRVQGAEKPPECGLRIGVGTPGVPV